MTGFEKNVSVKISEAQKNFLEFCEEFAWGKLEVSIKNGQPVLSKELVHDHKHD